MGGGGPAGRPRFFYNIIHGVRDTATGDAIDMVLVVVVVSGSAAGEGTGPGAFFWSAVVPVVGGGGRLVGLGCGIFLFD